MDTHLFCPDKHLAAKTGQTQPLATAPAGVLSAAHVRVLVVAVSTNAVGTSTWLWKLLTVSCAPRSSSALPPAAINVEWVTFTTWSSVGIRSTSFEAEPPLVSRRDPMTSMVPAVPSAMIAPFRRVGRGHLDGSRRRPDRAVAGDGERSVDLLANDRFDDVRGEAEAFIDGAYV